MRKFGEILKELSGGKYDVQVFPNSQLGKEDAYIASTRKGIIQMCATGTQTSAIQPSMAMLETPMLFDDYAHARRAMNGGKTFELITNGFTEKSGMRVLNAFPWASAISTPKAGGDHRRHEAPAYARAEHPLVHQLCQGMRHQRPAHAFRRSDRRA